MSSPSGLIESATFDHFSVWGTSGVLGVTDPAALASARQILDAEIDATDRAASRFRSNSEILSLNQRSGLGPQSVSPALLDLVRAALHACRATNGACDPTVADAVVALGYDRDFDLLASTPSRSAAGSAATPAPGIAGIEIDEETLSISLPASVHLDLGASAKARTADRAAESIHRLLGVGALVDLGGDLRVVGDPPPGGWIVGVVSSAREGTPREPDEVISITSGGLASSSTQVRRWHHAGSEVHHIIDPTTGRPAVGPWTMATTTAASCLDANALATAAIIWGEEALFELPQRSCAARLAGENGLVERIGGWPIPNKADVR